MVSEDFKESFVKTCMDLGCNADQTETLYKVAYMAQAFDNEEFSKGFYSQVDTEAVRPNSLSMFAKSELVDRAIQNQYEGE